MSAFAAPQQCATSPMKYRRSTSFPGKMQGQNSAHHDISGQGQNNIAHGAMDMNALDDVREPYMYHVSLPIKTMFHPIIAYIY